MTYNEIVTFCIALADRPTDVEVASNFDIFLRLVEAKVNRFLRTQKMSIHSTTPTSSTQYIYPLPVGFQHLKSVRLIPITADIGGGLPLSYVNVEQFTNAKQNGSEGSYYNITGDSVFIHPAKDNYLIDIEYFGSITPLTLSTPNNWLSEVNPDCYVFGVLCEINAFVKDAQSSALWGQRFMDTLSLIKESDKSATYSGNPLTVKVG
jgi:hypothetical protein